jgi:predicted DCC family thiol-disulfide oxidoreductase YuxK
MLQPEEYNKVMAPVVLFDGECNFCNFWVNFIIRYDKRGAFRFASLQSAAGKNLIQQAASDTSPEKLPDSLILLEDGKIYWESAAVLRIARRLSWFWPVFYLLFPIPRIILDAAYRRIAASRYRLFGRRNECTVPSKELRQRFLAATERK